MHGDLDKVVYYAGCLSLFISIIYFLAPNVLCHNLNRVCQLMTSDVFPAKYVFMLWNLEKNTITITINDIHQRYLHVYTMFIVSFGTCSNMRHCVIVYMMLFLMLRRKNEICVR